MAMTFLKLQCATTHKAEIVHAWLCEVGRAKDYLRQFSLGVLEECLATKRRQIKWLIACSHHVLMHHRVHKIASQTRVPKSYFTPDPQPAQHLRIPTTHTSLTHLLPQSQSCHLQRDLDIHHSELRNKVLEHIRHRHSLRLALGATSRALHLHLCLLPDRNAAASAKQAL